MVAINCFVTVGVKTCLAMEGEREEEETSCRKSTLAS